MCHETLIYFSVEYARFKKVYIVSNTYIILMILMITLESWRSSMVKIKCPVCCGTGKVDSDFGGGCPGGSKKSCPACCGTGMQEVSDYAWRKPCPNRFWINPYQPYTSPCNPWYTTPSVTWTVTNQTGSATSDTLNYNQTGYQSCSNTL